MIAQLCLSSSKGGLELSALKLTQEFKSLNQPSVCICIQDSFLHKQCEAKGLSTFTMKPKSLYFDLSTSLRLRKFIKDNGVKTIFAHHLRDLWLLYPTLIGLKEVEVIGFAHMFITQVKKKDFFHRLVYSNLKYLITMTEAQKQGLLYCLPLPESKYLHIPNGVDTEKFSPGPKSSELLSEWKVKPGQLVIGYVGRLDPQKGVFEFLKAAAHFKHRDDLKFVMVGDDTLPSAPTKFEVEKQIEELGLKESLCLRPFTPDVPQVMRSFDIFVMPSYEESFGLVLIEAMATGLACISTEAGGPPEILNFGETGVLAKPKSAEALIEVLTKLLESQSHREKLAVAARKRAITHYDGRMIFDKIKALAKI